jgi:hypothetical protein
MKKMRNIHKTRRRVCWSVLCALAMLLPLSPVCAADAPASKEIASLKKEVDGERRDSHGSIPKPVGNNHQAPRQRPNARGARG